MLHTVLHKSYMLLVYYTVAYHTIQRRLRFRYLKVQPKYKLIMYVWAY